MSGGGESSEYEVNINLTALLDVLTNLLFFLMLGMAAQQMSIEEQGNIHLPSSNVETPPKQDAPVTLGQEELRVEGQVVAKVRNGQIQAQIDKDGSIIPLRKRLTDLKGKRLPSTKDADVLFILCDKDAPYSTLRQVLMTAANVGFVKFRMAVIME